MVDINKSLLNKNNFKLIIDKCPNVEYYVRSVNIPGLTFTEVTQAAGVGLDAYYPGDKVYYETMSVEFLVDEDLVNFKEIYDWMDAIVPVRDPLLYKQITQSSSTETNISSGADSDLSQYSDITLVTNTNKNVPNRFFRFHDCFPISISGLQLESGADADPVTTTVEFRFGYYEIESVS